MTIEGRIFRACDVQKGMRKDGTEWRRQDVVVEYFENPTDMWTQKIVIQLNNANIDLYHLKEGDEVKVRFGLYANEWNGKYYQEVRLAQDGLQVISRAGAAQVAQPTEQEPTAQPQTQQEPTQQVTQAPEPKPQKENDLPF